MNRLLRVVAALIYLSLALSPVMSYAQPRTPAPTITVYKTPTSDCCDGWMSHLEKNGFKVEKKIVFGKGFTDLKRKHGVPEKLFACHTALIEGYIVEGHVPADLIYKLLKEKPQVLGLAVPGMPVGSPGMEGGKPEPYEVLTFDKSGRTTVYATR